MKTIEYINENFDDMYDSWEDSENLTDDPSNMIDVELKSRTAEMYGVPIEQLSFSRNTLAELYNLKYNYKSVSFDQAVSAICR
jgi:hypothetical protein